MSNVTSTVGRARLATHIPAKAALVLIERAAAANRSLSAYVADVLMASLHRRERPLPQVIGGRGPRSDADLVASANRIISRDAERKRARAAQVAKQKRTATKT